MSGVQGDALEWALALAQAPGERDALRRRALPDGIEALLQIAAGSHRGALQAAIARTGESEANLVEAVRFYLREVLFHSGADAYRVLGLAQDASLEQIKAHHRLLQHWLHPDRQTSDWDAIFAGRVNAAWNALRTPDRRAAYDAVHPAGLAIPPEAARRAAPRILAPTPEPRDLAAARWRRRAPVLVLFAACGLLGIAAVRDALREPDGRYVAASDRAARVPNEDPVALQLPQTPPKAPRATAPAVRRAAQALPGGAPVRKPAPTVAAGPTLMATRPTIGAATPGSPTAIASATAARTPFPREAIPVSIPQPLPEVPIVAARLKRPEPSPAPALRTPDVPIASPSAPPLASTRSAEAPTIPAVAAVPASAARIQLAQRTGDQLLAFLSGNNKRVPPIWDSLTAQQRAMTLRDTLKAADAVADEPEWRVAGGEATLRAAFGEGRRLRAQLVWRDQRWLVSAVALEQ